MSDTPDILLINLPPWGVDTPPLGTACLSGYLRSKGMRTKVFDLNIKLYNSIPGKYKYLWSMNYSHLWRQRDNFSHIYKELIPYMDPLLENIVCSPAKILGFSLPTNCSDLILREMVRSIKAIDISRTIVLGGVSISIPEQRGRLLEEIKNYVDYCVIGEGEEALYELLLSILNRDDKNFSNIKGVLDKENFFNHLTPVFIRDLNTLPFPTFEEFNLDEYEVSHSFIMEFSRGCIGNCPFCDFKSISPFFRTKSASYIFNQIKFYKEKYGINHISVCDAAVNGNIQVLEEVCDLLIGNNLSVNISALAIPRKEMTRKLLEKMKKAGFYRLEYGVESGSNKILKAMRKIFTVEMAEKVIRDTFEVGIRTYLYFIVGYPQETESDFDETKEFLKRNAMYISMIKSINPLYAMAGSEIFSHHRKYNIVLPSEDSDINWYEAAGGNTREVREIRVKELKNLAKQLRIPYTEEAEHFEFTEEVLGKKEKEYNLKKQGDG